MTTHDGGWFMCIKRAVSKLLLGKKIVEAKETRDREVAAKVTELKERVDRTDRDSQDVTMEIETMCLAHGSRDFHRDDD